MFIVYIVVWNLNSLWPYLKGYFFKWADSSVYKRLLLTSLVFRCTVSDICKVNQITCVTADNKHAELQ